MNTCLITGATKKLGKSTALYFAERGWNIILHYRKDDFLSDTIIALEKFDVEVFPIQFDINNIEQIQLAFVNIKNNFHFPNVLINNAAIFPNKTSIADIQVDDWDDVLNTNLRSILFLSKEFARYSSENSRIINIASVGAHKIFKKRLLYNLSKNGVIKITQLIAAELAPFISVNSVSPGYIDFGNLEEFQNIPNIDKFPMQRYASTDDINQAIYFFATTTNYITGQNLTVDGGLSL